MKARQRGEEVRQFMIEQAGKHSGDLGSVVARHFEISRQAVNQHLKKLVAEGVLTESGQTRGRQYHLATLQSWQRSYKKMPELAEDVVWRQDIEPSLGSLPENVLNIWYYGFTEMFNNALDHSGASEIQVHIHKTAADTEMYIFDNGVGIFKHIQAKLNLLDERHAIFELSKGKLTTDPKHHTGQGIFFTSRMFDEYEILSGGVYFSHQQGRMEDDLAERDQSGQGTFIRMKLANHSALTSKKIFDQYAGEEGDYEFDRTVVPIRLAKYGNDLLISRSQAKRVLARIELFRQVIFDFTEVTSIGQAFADEIFRVFALQHPEIELLVAHANKAVMQMITRAQAESLGR